ncbi:MAG: prepilin-type N-terminal cleavage/methylation domain-containing protein [Armatimonadetes bacterium]|nr:prepilin-type N-terminal cleavage/methylation domain-containing protein [Armatimonadota bacterium]
MRSENGFTLVELLVVIAIIAVLAAILFPVFLTVKENGRQNTCLSNLKQLGAGMRLYADEWNDHLPTSRLDNGGHENPSGNWAGVYDVHGICDPTKGQIFPYVRNVGVYLCPSDRGRNPARVWAPGALPYPLSYSLNNISDYRKATTMESHSCKVGLLIQEDRDSINDGDFYWYGWKDGGEGKDNPAKIHNGGTCVIFVDLHAKWQKYETVIEALCKGEWDPLHVSR